MAELVQYKKAEPRRRKLKKVIIRTLSHQYMKIVSVFLSDIEITDARTSKVISELEKDFLLSFHHKLGPEIERSDNLDSRIIVIIEK